MKLYRKTTLTGLVAAFALLAPMTANATVTTIVVRTGLYPTQDRWAPASTTVVNRGNFTFTCNRGNEQSVRQGTTGQAGWLEQYGLRTCMNYYKGGAAPHTFGGAGVLQLWKLPNADVYPIQQVHVQLDIWHQTSLDGWHDWIQDGSEDGLVNPAGLNNDDSVYVSYTPSTSTQWFTSGNPGVRYITNWIIDVSYFDPNTDKNVASPTVALTTDTGKIWFSR